ncbi:hypothetical protein [Gloeocapsa sp. PCC 73106]|uniref:hypothetical protein n=1 Tax=Gloeocapsa sp. PCC 73106 TaxID=102232 RepID=UPI0002AC057A|nr:hypothetical protein [Gloeocapsa sp. PCC 73106]ELR96709.1 hypothetical protein GLO73106DRAFT_00005060 [Gloeocapsa sp. PCC 73106]
MYRLNQQAWQILNQEIKKAIANDPVLGTIQGEIVQQRLERLRKQQGKPAGYEELSEQIKDMLPNFPDKILKKAAKVNQGSSPLSILPWLGVGVVGVGGLAGLIWVLNLPYPMIRRPVAKVAPIILLPSYISMDRNYREAIAHVEQADQLINQATSYADIELGAAKVQAAQKNLDALPVWFLGYEPVAIGSLWNFGWRFTFDEYKAARASVGRMEAKVFQETNADQQFQEAETKLTQAHQQYQQATTNSEKQTALNNWQQAIDQLTQLPSSTFAGKQAKTKLIAYQRDFQQISGTEAGASRSNILIGAAQQFSHAASTSCSQTPLAVTQWQQCESLWQQAISRLEQVPLEDPGYLEAQTLLANYRVNLGQVQIGLQNERASLEAFETAQRETESLLASFPSQPQEKDYNRVRSQLHSIINELNKVQPQSTVYPQAQSLLASAEKKLQEL